MATIMKYFFPETAYQRLSSLHICYMEPSKVPLLQKAKRIATVSVGHLLLYETYAATAKTIAHVLVDPINK